MEYQLIRNATARLGYGGLIFLLDPMLSGKGALRSFAGIAPNPTIELPLPVDAILSGVDAVIVSHLHPDHFDPAAAAALAKDGPILTPNNSAAANPREPATAAPFADQIVAMGFRDVTAIGSNESPTTTYRGVTLTQVFARHGKGLVGDVMGGVNGLIFQAEHEPTVYWTGDTIFDEEGRVAGILDAYRPDVVIAHTGGPVVAAIAPDPLLMDETQAVRFVEKAKAVRPDVRVIAVHMEALDHCFTTRAKLREALEAAGVADDVRIPADGETVRL